MKLSALVAYRPTSDGWRDRAFTEVVLPYLAHVADEVIIEAPPPAGDGSPDDFNKPAAINAARARATGDVLLVADADTHPGDVVGMTRLLLAPSPWVLPQRYVKLTRAATEARLGSPGPIVYDGEADYEWVGDGVSWSAGVVVRARDFDFVGGYDERFSRWGADDVAFARMMNVLVGEVERHPCDCYHYWHPGAEDRAQPDEQHRLMYRYLEADTAEDLRRVRWSS